MIDNTQQKASASYRLAELDSDFILDESMRGLRLNLEFAKAEERLCSWGIHSTIVVLGSSRIGRPETSTGASQATIQADKWYAEARRFGNIASERGGAARLIDGIRRNVIATGGGPGLMEAANRGAFEAGAPSIGFNIQLPLSQEPNAFSTPDLTFQFRSFAIRKMHLAMRATALVVFPGGFGTFDELFEILTLVQTRKAPPIPIVCVDRGYWTRAVDFDFLVETGTASRPDLELLRFADDAEEAWQILCRERQLITSLTPLTPANERAV